MIGTLEEARALFDAVGDRWNDGYPPPGWKHLGSGGTRAAYLSPSGVVFKVCHEYEDDEKSHNEREHENFKKIVRCGKLPGNWRVPRSYLHHFQTEVQRWNYSTKAKEVQPTRVVILACDYIAGQEIGGWAEGWDECDMEEMERAFLAVGLHDVGGGNAVRCADGTHYIIDAAEDALIPA